MSLTLGRYELLKELGRGGMAEVFLARRRGPGGVEKRLAIKRIRRERASDPRLLSMFVDEARLSMTMVHKNIVPMFDFGRAGDELFLVMEYVDGADLGAALKGARQRAVPLAPEVAAFIAMEACQALDYAHTMSGERDPGRVVIHRDVNPRNVLLSYAGEVKLVDFGVATAETDLGRAGKVRGTPAYMAPEQARAETVDARADVFSLGLILWEALAGRRAYGGDTLEETLAAARCADVAPLPDSVPERLRAIVAKATAKAIDARHASARELQLELDEYLVAARAAGRGGPPLAHRLADWLRLACPPNGRQAVLPEHVVTPSGQVVTYLDDGEAKVERVIATSAGSTTQRSMAETLADDKQAAEGADASRANGEGAHEDASAASRRSRVWPGVALAGVLGAVAAGLAVVLSGSARTTTTDADAATAARVGARIDDSRDAGVVARGVADAGASGPAEGAPGNVRDAASASRPKAPATAAHDEPRRDASGRRAPADAGVAVAPGTVRVSSSPWATVTVSGQKASCAETPCELELPPGDHQLQLRNPHGNLEKTVRVHVTSGQTTDVIENLTR